MNQGTTDQEEWQKDENWGGPKWGEVYFSKKDPRIIVPKRIKMDGVDSQPCTYGRDSLICRCPFWNPLYSYCNPSHYRSEVNHLTFHFG